MRTNTEPARAPVIMLQGTASSVGKSLLVAALCRILADEGVRVAPFKAQNMSLNAAAVPGGGEIARSQALQAVAARIEPEVDLNPVLLKPTSERGAQVILHGRPLGHLGALDYQERKAELRDAILASLERLRRRFALVVAEGAGSPAEVNLRERDLANMFVAEAADAEVWLVGDIDRGGVLAAFAGTLALLRPRERARVRGLVVNRFRGDRRLLEPALAFLERELARPVLGVVPELPAAHLLPEEDSQGLRTRDHGGWGAATVRVAVVRLPHLANFDDVTALRRTPGVEVRFVTRPEALWSADLVVLPGSRATLHDLAWLRSTGLAAALEARARAGGPILGICGGCQMLGERITDPEGIEAAPGSSVAGLGLLPLRTRFAPIKRTLPVRIEATGPHWLTVAGGDGYWIHHGRSERTAAVPAAFTVRPDGGDPVPDGAVAGAVVGTMVHGLFENPAAIVALGSRFGERLRPPPGLDTLLDELAAGVRAALRPGLVSELVSRARVAA